MRAARTGAIGLRALRPFARSRNAEDSGIFPVSTELSKVIGLAATLARPGTVTVGDRHRVHPFSRRTFRYVAHCESSRIVDLFALLSACSEGLS